MHIHTHRRVIHTMPKIVGIANETEVVSRMTGEPRMHQHGIQSVHGGRSLQNNTRGTGTVIIA